MADRDTRSGKTLQGVWHVHVHRFNGLKGPFARWIGNAAAREAGKETEKFQADAWRGVKIVLSFPFYLLAAAIVVPSLIVTGLTRILSFAVYNDFVLGNTPSSELTEKNRFAKRYLKWAIMGLVVGGAVAAIAATAGGFALPLFAALGVGAAMGTTGLLDFLDKMREKNPHLGGLMRAMVLMAPIAVLGAHLLGTAIAGVKVVSWVAGKMGLGSMAQGWALIAQLTAVSAAVAGLAAASQVVNAFFMVASRYAEGNIGPRWATAFRFIGKGFSISVVGVLALPVMALAFGSTAVGSAFKTVGAFFDKVAGWMAAGTKGGWTFWAAVGGATAAAAVSAVTVDSSVRLLAGAKLAARQIELASNEGMADFIMERLATKGLGGRYDRDHAIKILNAFDQSKAFSTLLHDPKDVPHQLQALLSRDIGDSNAASVQAGVKRILQDAHRQNTNFMKVLDAVVESAASGLKSAYQPDVDVDKLVRVANDKIQCLDREHAIEAETQEAQKTFDAIWFKNTSASIASNLDSDGERGSLIGDNDQVESISANSNPEWTINDEGIIKMVQPSSHVPRNNTIPQDIIVQIFRETIKDSLNDMYGISCSVNVSEAEGLLDQCMDSFKKHSESPNDVPYQLTRLVSNYRKDLHLSLVDLKNEANQLLSSHDQEGSRSEFMKDYREIIQSFGSSLGASNAC